MADGIDPLLNAPCSRGRTAIELVDGTTLSCITSDRDAVLNEEMVIEKSILNLVSLVTGIGTPRLEARSGGDFYEVAIVDSFTRVCRQDILPVELVTYLDTEISTSGWTIFGNVPADTINAYAEKIGRKHD